MTRQQSWHIAALLWTLGALIAALVVWSTASTDVEYTGDAQWAAATDGVEGQAASPPLPALLPAATDVEVAAFVRLRPGPRWDSNKAFALDVLSRAPKRPPPTGC